MPIKFIFMLGFVALLSGCASQNRQSPQIDRISEQELARIMPKPVAVLSLDDVVKLSQDGVAAEQIIDRIKQSNSLYDLSPSQSVGLHQQGVDNKVLDYMHSSRELAVRNNIADEINKREKSKRDALERLKRQQLEQQRLYDPFCGYGSYGFYPYGGYYGRHFGLGAGFHRPWGCW